ncbi:hypothetical protein ACFL18_02415 [Patescibacteria group bacterium]
MAKKQQVDLSGIFKEKKLIGLAAAGLMMAVIVFGPILKQLNGRQATKKQLSSQLQQLQKKLNTLNGIEPILIDDRVKQMEAVFPSQKPIVQLIGALSQLSSDRGLSFGGISLQPGSLEEEQLKSTKKKGKTTTTSVDLRDLRFGFSIGGNFDSILLFMKDLENVAPLMKIESVGLSIKTNPLFEKEETLVVANIEVAAYYQAPPQKLGAVSAPVKLLDREQEALLNKLTDFKAFKTVIPVAPTGKQDLFE